ncbi:OmpA family protein [Thiohalocapsa halophila]
MGDPAANLALSERRAAVVAETLAALGFARDRLAAIGVGAAEPLPRRDAEGELSYQKRLGRASVLLRVP